MANEINYRRKLKAYQKTYLEFRYDSPFVIPMDNFDILDFNQYDACVS